MQFVPIVSGVATVDASLGTNAETSSFLVILTANVTSLNIINAKIGQQLTIAFQQDAVGSRTVSYASNILNGVTVNALASTVTAQAFVYDENINKWSGLSGTTAGGVSGVTSFNTRTGAVTLSGADVTTALPTAVVATSPGAGIAHFAGSTQTVTSSAVDLTADVTGILPSANGGTANGFFTVAGPASSAKTYTFPNANATITQTIASGTATLGTSLIASGAAATVVTVSATGTLTTDCLMADFNADPTGVVGYQPSSSGMLTIIKYPTADNVNFKVVNNTLAGITPGAITLNWRVVR